MQSHNCNLSQIQQIAENTLQTFWLKGPLCMRALNEFNLGGDRKIGRIIMAIQQTTAGRHSEYESAGIRNNDIPKTCVPDVILVR